MQDARARFSALCLELPAAVQEEAGAHIAFSVRGKKFAWYLDDHHGDGRLAANLRAPAGRNEALAEAHPERFFIPAYLGPRGWVGAWLDLEGLDWEQVAALVGESYLLAA